MKNKTPKTPPYRLKANAKYDDKVAQKTVRLKRVEDADLLQAINNDDVSFNLLVNNLLRMYYGLEEEIDYSNETEEQTAARVREEIADFKLTIKSLHRYHDMQREMMARKLNDGSLVLPDEYFNKKDKIEWGFNDNNKADAIFSYSINVLELTGKTMHLLQSNRIKTIGELVAVNEDDLIKADSYIDRAIKHELWNVLKASGLRLGMSPSDIMEYQPMYSDLLAKMIVTEPHLTKVK